MFESCRAHWCQTPGLCLTPLRGVTAWSSDSARWALQAAVARDEPLVVVEVVNATMEQDGTRKHYFLRVPPDMRSAREAVAWTFDMPANRYEPRRES